MCMIFVSLEPCFSVLILDLVFEFFCLCSSAFNITVKYLFYDMYSNTFSLKAVKL